MTSNYMGHDPCAAQPSHKSLLCSYGYCHTEAFATLIYKHGAMMTWIWLWKSLITIAPNHTWLLLLCFYRKTSSAFSWNILPHVKNNMVDTDQQLGRWEISLISKAGMFEESQVWWRTVWRVDRNCLLKCTLKLFEFLQKQYGMMYSRGLVQSGNQLMLKSFFAFRGAKLKLNFWPSCCQRAQLRKSTSKAYGLFTSTVHHFVQRHQHWSGFTPIRNRLEDIQELRKDFRRQLIIKVQCGWKSNDDDLLKTIHSIVASSMS